MAADTDLVKADLLNAARLAAGHPAKLVIDVAALAAAMVALWGHQWLIAAIVAIVPGLAATVVVAVWARSARSGWLARVPAAWAQSIRVIALVVAVWAAWTHQLTLLVLAMVVGAAVLLPLPGARRPIPTNRDT